MSNQPLLPRMTSLLGLVVMLAIAWLLSENRKRVPWRIIGWGLALQLLFGVLVLKTQVGKPFFGFIKSGFDALTASATAGAKMLFGPLSEVFVLTPGAVEGSEEPLVVNAVFAFQVLPVIIFVSALAAVLHHLKIIQALVGAMAWLMRRTLKTSGAETFGAALLVFTGIESVSALRGYLEKMTRSELCTVMTTFMATIAASVMVAYAAFGAEPGHLMAASLMSAPAAIIISKLMVPETGVPSTQDCVQITLPVESHNVAEAATQGASAGLKMALNVGAIIIAFVGFVFLLNLICTGVLRHPFTEIIGWFFRPFAFLLGVPRDDVVNVSELLAKKTVLNEFLAYKDLDNLISGGAISSRAKMISTYALCGFANPGSMGIAIGALTGLMPNRRQEIVTLGLKSLIGGTLACFMTACVAGMLLYA